MEIVTEARQEFLYAGAITIHSHRTLITTVLGSCVSICLWDENLHIGGMNHYQLALWNGHGLASPKYGNIAIKRLVDSMLRRGADFNTLKAKVFGGASVLMTKSDSLRVGEHNVEIAWEWLKKYRIPVLASDVGGTQGRKIKFDTETGLVHVKRLGQSSFNVSKSA